MRPTSGTAFHCLNFDLRLMGKTAQFETGNCSAWAVGLKLSRLGSMV